MTDALSMWTVYNSPADYPGKIVVRRWELRRGHAEPIATADVQTFAAVDDARDVLMRRGLCRLPRQHGDDSVIVESWI